MYPLLKDGQTVLVTSGVDDIQPGKIIVFHHPFREMDCIKRVKKINPDGSVEVTGENIESEDAIGAIHPKDIVGKMMSVI